MQVDREFDILSKSIVAFRKKLFCSDYVYFERKRKLPILRCLSIENMFNIDKLLLNRRMQATISK
jgi:hypothetical protein